MGLIRRNKKIKQFRYEFEKLLPRSFDDIYLYINKKYGREKLPVYRSPSGRHLLLFVTKLDEHFKNPYTKLDERVGIAMDEYHKNEFIASFTAPFDNIERSDELDNKIDNFFRDLEDLNDDQFKKLYKYLYNSFPRIMFDKFKWWLRKKFPNILLKFLTIVTALVFLIQTVIKLNLIKGALSFSIFNYFIKIPYISIFYSITILLISILAIKSGGTKELIFKILVILFLPIYGLIRLLGYLTVHVYNIAYEQLLITDKKYKLKNIFRNVKFLISTTTIYIISLYFLIVSTSKLWLLSNIFIVLISQIILILWFYYWNFQPLFFLNIGLRFYFGFQFLNFKKKKKQIEKLSKNEIDKHIWDLKLLKQYCKRMKKLLKGTRFNVFSANSFIILFLIFFIILIFQFSSIYYAFYKIDQNSFYLKTVYSKSIEKLNFYDFLRLGFNNLPIGGENKLSSHLFSLDLLLFAERFYVALILAISIFAFSYFSNDQLESAKEEINNFLSYKQRQIWNMSKRYQDVLDTNIRPLPLTSGSSGKKGGV